MNTTANTPANATASTTASTTANATANTTANATAAISTSAYTKYYGKARGIIDVNLTVDQGDFFGFIGPNGAGKSTLIRALLGLIHPTSGQAYLLGKDCAKERTEILTQVGYMPSEAQFYHGMKVKDVLKFSANLRKKDCAVRALELCERLNLDKNRKVNELSFGNRKKVGIVCALQHCPPLYILDEPTSGLDPLIQKEFFSILGECNEDGATVMLSSHVLSEVQRYCRHAAIIQEGKIIASGAVKELSSTASRWVRLRGCSTVPLQQGVHDTIVHDDNVDFLYQGDMQALIHALDGLDFDDITIEEPNIEEVFMHFYEQGGVS